MLTGMTELKIKLKKVVNVVLLDFEYLDGNDCGICNRIKSLSGKKLSKINSLDPEEYLLSPTENIL